MIEKLALAKDGVVSGPEALHELRCILCHLLLSWVDEYTPLNSKYPMDVTAHAYCCGRIYNAYATSISVYSGKDGE